MNASLETQRMAFLVLAGVIHLIPVTGDLVAERLRALYGVTLEDPTLRLLMQHRAILLGLLGALLVAAAFVPALQISALIGGLVSTISFLILARVTRPTGEATRRVVVADVVALLSLVGAAIITLRSVT